jgi:curved DNA-binding protein CbpA
MPLDAHRAYRVLGLEPAAKPEDVKTAYRDLAQVWHPDRFPVGSRLRDKAERNLKRINEAYTLLKDYEPAAHPAPRRMRASISAILGIGDLRESGAFQATGPLFRRSIRILGLEQVVSAPRSHRARWVIGALVLLAAIVLLLVTFGSPGGG